MLFVGLTVACGEEKDRESAARATAEMQDDATDTGNMGETRRTANTKRLQMRGRCRRAWVEGGLLSAERSTVTAEVVAAGAVICHENAGATSSARVVEPPMMTWSVVERSA